MTFRGNSLELRPSVLEQAGIHNTVLFECEVDANNKSKEFEPFKNKAGGFIPINWGKSKHTNPHMRGFWFATLGSSPKGSRRCRPSPSPKGSPIEP